MVNKEANTKVVKARTSLITYHPFFGTLALHLDIVERRDIPTMATDGRCIYYNPKFVLGLPDIQLMGVWAHEVFHCTYQHMSRRGHRHPKGWNIACDYVINPDLLDDGFKLPKWVLFDPKYKGMSAEEVYELLPKDQQQGESQPQQGQQGQGQPGGGGGDDQGDDPAEQGGQAQQNGENGGGAEMDPGGCGGILDAAPDYDEEGQKEAAEHWEKITRQAVMVAKAAGKLPGSLDRLLEKLNEPRMSWKELTRQFIDESASKDLSWNKPNKRYLPQGIILPGYVPDRLNHLVVGIDTSGSIINRLLTEMNAEVQSCMDEGVMDKLTVIYADAEVHKVDEFTAGDEIIFDPKGGGGTSFRPTFDWLAKNVSDCSAFIYFTDLEVIDFGEDPGVPVMWAVYGDSRRFKQLSERTPFGDSIYVSP